MKNKLMLLLGVGLVVYYFYKKKKGTTDNVSLLAVGSLQSSGVDKINTVVSPIVGSLATLSESAAGVSTSVMQTA